MIELSQQEVRFSQMIEPEVRGEYLIFEQYVEDSASGRSKIYLRHYLATTPEGKLNQWKAVLESEGDTLEGRANQPADDPDVLRPVQISRLIYNSCESLPDQWALPHAEAIAFLGSVQSAIDACKIINEELCFKAIFNSLEVVENDKLSVAEIARLIRIAAYFAAASRDTGVKVEELGTGIIFGTLLGPLVAQSLVSGSDYDADGQLSLKEFLQDKPPGAFMVAAKQVSLQTTVGLLGKLFQQLAPMMPLK
ncbi:hypothetical protein [Pelagibius sp.]|uniref:hypothetical protein n=1 Tax=Pelagibius sp. TaxID=1931238 RepID=UPI002632F04D|nr:hypothetical protein [Pelagibius sp.]